jgi:hypothetical protein
MANGASVFWAIRGAPAWIFVWGHRFSSRAPQTPPQKPDAAYFIVDLAQIFEKKEFPPMRRCCQK